MYEKELEISIKSAISAGLVIMEVYEKDFSVDYKSDLSPLTIADKLANDLIIKNLRKYFPDYSILSEEEKDNKDRLNNPYCFIIDPLDGTKEFIKRNGEFTVNIALSYYNEIVIGVIYAPNTKELYYAYKDGGAYYCILDDKYEMRDVIRIGVSSNLTDLILVESRSHSSYELEDFIVRNEYKIGESISIGSSLKGCMIARGVADIYYRFNPICEWDIAAMSCIVRESGGIIRKLSGEEIDFNNFDILIREGFFVVNREENILL